MHTRLAATVLAVAGLIIALPTPVVFAFNAVAMVQPVKAEAAVALIELDEHLADRQRGMTLFGESRGTTVRDVVTAMETASKREGIVAIVLRLKDVELNASRIDELGQAISAARKAGKKVHVFSDNYGPSELRLGSFADEVIIQRGGGVSLPGIHMEEMFLADMFAWAGVKADFVQVGDYKGASEQFANSKPSPAWNQNIDALLDSMYKVTREQLKSGRKLDDAALDKAMETCWMASDEEGIRAGLIDKAIDLPDLSDHLEKTYGKPVTWKDDLVGRGSGKDNAAAANPFTLFSKLMNPPEYKPKRATIAVVHIDGAIIDGESTSGGLMGSASVGSRTIRRTLSDLEDNKLIKGVVMRIDSPGGSAIASEVIWQGVKRLAKIKPVWVSIGNMAASGGYYITVAGDKVYVNPSSIVGSIGVVGGKFALGGLMEKVHINTVSRARGPRAAMESMANPWTDADRKLVRAKMEDTYKLFTGRVAQGRAGIDLAKTAEGRLFVGQDAVSLKMADQVGTLKDVIGDLAREVKLAGGSFDIMDYPAPMGFQEMIENSLGSFNMGATGPTVSGAVTSSVVTATLGQVVRQVMGDQAFLQARGTMDAALQMRKERVLLVTPSVLIFR